MDNMYGFIGAGNMAKAIINGIISQNICESKKINAFDIDEKKCSEISSKTGINSLESAKQIVLNSKYIFLAENLKIILIY